MKYMARILVFFILVEPYIILSFEQIYPNHWFVKVKTLHDLMNNLENTIGNEKLYLSVDLMLGYLTERDANLNRTNPLISWSDVQYNDLSLSSFLDTFIALKSVKNTVVKFNFVDSNALEPALIVLQSKKDQLPIDIWLHANVLKGPQIFEDADDQSSFENQSIDASKFFELVDKFDDKVVVSLGWVLKDGQTPTRYEWGNVREMANMVRCLNVYHPINVEYKINMAERSVAQIFWLLNAIPRSSVELQDQDDFNLHYDTLVKLSMALSDYPLYFSLPTDTDGVEKFRLLMTTRTMSANIKRFDNRLSVKDNVDSYAQWLVRPYRPPTSQAKCILSPYVASTSIMINGGETTFLVRDQRYKVPTSFMGKLTVMENTPLTEKRGYYISTVSIVAMMSKKVPNDLNDLTTDEIVSVLSSEWDLALNHYSKSGEVNDSNNEYYFRLSVGDDRCSYIAKEPIDVSVESDACPNKQTLQGDYVVYAVVYEGWNSVVLTDISFNGLTLNDAFSCSPPFWILTLCIFLLIR